MLNTSLMTKAIQKLSRNTLQSGTEFYEQGRPHRYLPGLKPDQVIRVN